jgi:hypothetical protein
MPENIGLFHVKYITSGPPGAPILHLDLLVNTPNKTITGWATVTAALAHPILVSCPVVGVYSVMTVMPKITHIQLKLHGVVLGDGNLAAAEPASALLEALAVLNDSWSTGEVQYTYLNHPKQIEQPIQIQVD